MVKVLAAICFALLFASGAIPAPAQTAHLETVLPNGLRVIVVQDRLAPVVTTMMTYGVGSDDDTAPGIAHAVEHMLFRGFDGLTSGQFADIATRMGGDYNAETTNEYTRYYFTAPSQYLGLILKLEAMRMTGAWIAGAEWANEAGAIEQEIAAHESNPAYEVSRRIRERMFVGTPLANDAGGSTGSIRTMTAAQIRAFYRTWYHPNNATLVVAGDVVPSDVLARVRALFKAIPRIQVPAHAPILVTTPASTVMEERADVPQATVAFVYRFPSLTSPDYAAGLVLQSALDDPRGALAELTVDRKTQGAGMTSGAFPEVGYAFVSAGVRAASSADATRLLLEQTMQSYLRDGVPPSLVSDAKRGLSASRAFEMASIQGLALAWANAAAVHEQSPMAMYRRIDAVTIGDVNRVLRRYLSPDRRFIVLLQRNENAPKPAIAAPITVENVKYTGSTPEQPPLWALAYFKDALHKPLLQQHARIYVLPNGLHLAVLTDRTAPAVMMAAAIKMNQTLDAAPGKQGIAEITSALQAWGGGGYDRKELAAAASAIPAAVFTGNRFGLRAQAKDFDRALALLAEAQLHPAFPEQGLQTLRELIAQSLKQEQSRPEWTARLAMEAALYPASDPVRRHPTPQSVNNITLDDVKAWYRYAYRPDLTTIAVVGDVSPAYARNEIEKYFGGWHARGPKPDFHYPKIALNGPANINVPSPDAQQSVVTLTELLPVHRSDRDYPALVLANAILSGEGMGSQLFEDLRKNTGYVYDVGSILDIGKVRSTYQFRFAADPKNAGVAAARLLADLRHMQTGLLSAGKLVRAKEALMARSLLPLSSYGGLAGSLLEAASGTRDRSGDVLTVTPEQIRAAMARWIRVNDFVRVTISPSGGK